MASNGNTGAVGGGLAGVVNNTAISTSNVTTTSKHTTGPFLGPHAHHPHSQRGLHHLAEGRKAKLRRFNSHDTSSNMFSVADFENARLARRNEIELKQRLQRRMRHGYNGVNGNGLLTGQTCGQGLLTGSMGDYSTGDSKASKNSNESQNEPLQVEEFLERYSLPRVVRISYKTLFSNETLQSSSSNTSTNTTTSNSSSSAKNITHVPSGDTNMIGSNSNSNTGTASSSASSGMGGGIGATSQTLGSNSSNNSAANKSLTNDGNHTTNDSNHNNGTSHADEEQGELFLLYRLVRQRHIYHGHNSKSTTANRKKGVMIPQEFPGE